MWMCFSLFFHFHSFNATEATNRLSIQVQILFDLFESCSHFEHKRRFKCFFFLNTAFQVEKPSHTKLNSILNVGNFALYCRFGWWYIRMHNLYHHTSIFFFFREANKMRFDPAESKKKSARFTTHSFNIEWAAFETHCYSQSHGRCSNNKNNNNNNINRK